MSVSRHGVWDDCKQKYKFRYHLGIPPEYEQFYFTYGKIIHKIADIHVRSKGEIRIPDAAKMVIYGEVPIEKDKFAPPLPTEYKNRLGPHLKSLTTITEQLGFDGEIEYPFEYDLDPPNNKKLVGFIDRLIPIKDSWFVLDYKTTKPGKYRKTKNTVIYDLQLRCYAKVVQKQFDVPADKIKTALYYLEGGNLIGAQFSQESLDSAEQELKKAYDEILGYDPDKVWGTVGDSCQRCDYKKICHFYKASL